MSRRALLAGGLVLALLVGLAVVLWPSGGSRHVRAEFVRAVGLYEGSDVRILGVKVGKVTSVRPAGDRVVVDMTYDDKYSVPADAKAVVVSPSVVSDPIVPRARTPRLAIAAASSRSGSLRREKSPTPSP